MCPTLAQTQDLLWKLITAPEGVAAGITRLQPAERALAESLVRDGGRLSCVERLDVYANMYFYRLHDALKEDFRAVAAVLGARDFHNAVTDYLLAHPPSHFSLRYAGQHLPAFLATHRAATQHPYLPDLAKLEWSILDAFDAADAQPLAPEALRTIPPQQWPALRFHVTPSLRLLDAGWPVHEVWQAAQENVPAPVPDRQRTWLRVWRHDLRVFHRPMDGTESGALQRVATGHPFAEVCEDIAAQGGGTPPVERAAQLLDEWLSDGVLVGIACA